MAPELEGRYATQDMTDRYGVVMGAAERGIREQTESMISDLAKHVPEPL